MSLALFVAAGIFSLCSGVSSAGISKRQTETRWLLFYDYLKAQAKAGDQVFYFTLNEPSLFVFDGLIGTDFYVTPEFRKSRQLISYADASREERNQVSVILDSLEKSGNASRLFLVWLTSQSQVLFPNLQYSRAQPEFVKITDLPFPTDSFVWLTVLPVKRNSLETLRDFLLEWIPRSLARI
ncbi:MAG: hypothetical protein ACXWQO_11900 [Bdellovibrionota bacterium]